jgi:DNA-binding MarR family transcriptional regulator
LLNKAIAELGDSLGDVGTYRADNGNTAYYSPAQQELIKLKLNEMDVFAPQAPEGYLSISGIAKAIGVDFSTVSSAIEGLGDGLGEVDRFKFKTVRALGYSPSQQESILRQLEEKGLIVDIAPEGVLTINGIADSLGFGSSRIITRAIDELGDAIGEQKKYRFGTRKQLAIGYNAEQQQLIANYLQDKGLLEIAPDGYLNRIGLSRELGVTSTQIKIVIDSMGDDLGETRRFRSAPRSIAYYSPHQQELIRDALDKAGYLNNDPPEGYLPVNAISNNLGRSQSVVDRVVKVLGEELGEVRSYKFKTLVTKGYSPEQQEMIANYLKSEQR